MATFLPVTTLADLETLDRAEIVKGYVSAEHGDPEPGENLGRAFWHGWRCRMMDMGEIEVDAEHRRLVAEYVYHTRSHGRKG